MKRTDIVAGLAMLLLIVALGIMWLSESYSPIIFDRSNVSFQLPNSIIRWLLGGTVVLVIACFNLLWNKRCFDCQQNMFIDKGEVFGCFFVTAFLYSLPLLIILIYSYIFVNGFFDRSPSYQIQNVVIDKYKHHSSKGGTTYLLTLKNHQNLIYLPIKADEYERTNCNDNVIINAKVGLLNVPWRENYKIISQH